MPEAGKIQGEKLEEFLESSKCKELLSRVEINIENFIKLLNDEDYEELDFILNDKITKAEQTHYEVPAPPLI